MKINIANPTTGMQKQLVLIWSCHFCEAENCFANHAWFALQERMSGPGEHNFTFKGRSRLMMTRSCTLFSTSVWHRRQLWSNWTKQERYGLAYVVQMRCVIDGCGRLSLCWYEPIETFLTTDVACEGVGWFPRRWVQGILEFVTQVIYLCCGHSVVPSPFSVVEPINYFYGSLWVLLDMGQIRKPARATSSALVAATTSRCCPLRLESWDEILYM